MYKNGSIIDYKEYYARMVTDSLYADGLAYDWKTDNKGGSSSYSINESSTGGNRNNKYVSDKYFSGAKFNYLTGFWEGPLVQQQVDTNSSQQEVSKSSGNIVGRFK